MQILELSGSRRFVNILCSERFVVHKQKVDISWVVDNECFVA